MTAVADLPVKVARKVDSASEREGVQRSSREGSSFQERDRTEGKEGKRERERERDEQGLESTHVDGGVREDSDETELNTKKRRGGKGGGWFSFRVERCTR